MRTLPDPGCEALVDHLLICSACQERLDAELEFVAAMREAAAIIREVEKS